ncbi:hypothetical protein D9M71_570640 [compost metagenome]
MPKYPDSLPRPLKADRAFEMIDPLVATPFDSGQTRWDRRFTDVPTETPVSFIFNDAQCQAFQAWYRDQLADGALWFDMPLRSPIGRRDEQCHFVRGYSGPRRLGFDRWRVEAMLRLRRIPLPPMGEGNFPDDIVYSELFDLTINREMPA